MSHRNRLRNSLCRTIGIYLSIGLAPLADQAIQLRDAGLSSGIDFRHDDGSSGHRYLMENIASGLGLIDYDNDGDLDIYLLNGASLAPSSDSPAPSNALYRNDGNWRFTNVTRQSGDAADSGYAMGCAVADYDNDGDQDIYVTNYGPNLLLRNDGDGRFTDVAREAGVDDSLFGAGCSFLDFDRDGLLDLYVSNYLEFDVAAFVPCRHADIPVYCDPRTYPPQPDRLYRNLGGGRFEDVSETAGIDRKTSYGMGTVCLDFDDDGWTDIFVGNDIKGNFLFRNQGDGTFKETALLAGVAFDEFGDPQGTMGVNAGDYDGDGRFDLLVTTYQNQANTLYRNLGSGQFQDVSAATGSGVGSLHRVTWGCGFPDLDNDGRPELFIAAGHLQDTVEQYNGASTYKQSNQLLSWDGNRFSDIAGRSGDALGVVESSRGAVFGDLDNDGDIDIVVQNARSRPTVIVNETKTDRHWTLLQLVGTQSNRSAVGARVRLTAGKIVRVDEVRAGRGYQGADDLRLHFGLDRQTVIDRVEVRWPNGQEETWNRLPTNRRHVLTEGASAD